MNELENVKAGDTLILSYSFNLPKPIVVKRTTAKLVIIVEGMMEVRFNRKGRRIGQTGYHRSQLTVPRPGQIEECQKLARQERLSTKLRDFNFSKLSLETLENIHLLTIPAVKPIKS